MNLISKKARKRLKKLGFRSVSLDKNGEFYAHYRRKEHIEIQPLYGTFKKDTYTKYLASVLLFTLSEKVMKKIDWAKSLKDL